MNIRPPAVAGSFYDKSPETLQCQLDSWLIPTTDEYKKIRAVVVPHAGYVYSGKVAAQAYRYLKSQADTIKRVILIGPSHRYFFQGCAIPSVDYFASPLGNIAIDKQSVEILREIDDIEVSDQIHAFEHCLEVQLPFLQTCLNEFTLLPLLTSNVSPVNVANIIDSLWQDDSTLLVISSDLSHYHPYSEAQKIDQDTCSLIEHYDPSLTPEQACGSTGINTLLLLAKQRDYQITRIELKNSGDTAGDKERVVGYVSYLISEPK
ncbi:AmmeMemoRadiSam system protein B [Photobacterium proteolyticum]|uniref:MEMO1 family protein BIT28_12440 n=1 Tax=Photobacterium proteolyticum TaxID=1903952 RepID=A0A1Q9GJT9_9GAMM|nr:AmmeMemoRadiSam system protein B [Photobacterium proteolyticum]OLQ74771.1 AmmeMemoRadiSam system protein B [Photobacterium proteolyticum]